MNKNPFLSVIMPVYNAEEYLSDTISSILNQTFQDFELIIVDDKSTDKSRDICGKFQQTDSRIKLVTVEKNGGAGNARNIGIQVAKGEYIAFIDSDDSIDSNLYSEAHQMVVENDVDMVVWGITEEYYDKQGGCYLRNPLYLSQKICNNLDEIKDAVILLEEKTLFGYQWNRFYRAAILKEYHILFEKVILYEDYFFNLEVIKHIKKMGILENVGYHYMKRQNESITTRYVPEYFELSKRRIVSMYQLYQQWNVQNALIYNILGERYLRYILAGLAKSYDKRATSTYRIRKEWLSSIKREDIYKQICQMCPVKQKELKIFQFVVNKEAWFFSIEIGRTVWVIKEKLPMLFNKIRKFK